MKSFLLILSIGALLSFSACGGGGTGTISPPPVTYTVSASVTGLASGTSVVLQDNAGGTLTFSSNATQAFSNSYNSGAAYSVSVSTQPSNQTCALGSNASGTASSNITVAVTCTTSTTTNFTISVAVTGLTSGTLVLQDDAGKQLTFSSNTTQTFPNTYASGAKYSVTPVSLPPNQNCAAGINSSGTITANITVSVACSPASTYTISANVTGLTAGTLVLQDDAGSQLSFTSNGTQAFANSYVSGAAYTVSVATQPANQTCTPLTATGTITSNTTLNFTCAAVTYTLGASVTGLTTGTLIVQDNVGDQLSFNSNGTQTFGHSYASGASYTVSIASQPIGENCIPVSTTGTITANTTIAFTCTLGSYTISASVTGLTSGTLVLQDNNSDTLSFTGNTTQTFAKSYTSGAAYTVSVQTQPSSETCTPVSTSGNITSNITLAFTCAPVTYTISATVTGLTSGTLKLQDNVGDTLSFTSNGSAQTFASSYASGAAYTVTVATQPPSQNCTLSSNSTGNITSNITIIATCTAATSRPLGTVSNVSPITPCSGSITNGVCDQMTVSCPGVPDIEAYIKINTPTGTSKGTVLYAVGTDGNGLYDSIYTYGSTAVGNVLAAGFTTVQISFGTPFNNTQPGGWVQGPGGVLAAACRYATIAQYVYTTVQNNTGIPMCATANSGGAGALAYALTQYGSGDIISMAEVTSGPPTGRLDWGCGCKQGSMPVPTSCFPSGTMGTCFGTTDAGVWDPAYTPNAYCSQAVQGTLPPGGLTFFLDDSVEAPGASYNMPKTKVNLLFGGKDTSSAIPIGWDWYNNIVSTKSNACVADAPHSIPNVLDGATQIANDLIGMCALQ